MVTLCWATKGGTGTTVITATLALESERPALLVDLDGELPIVLGMDEPTRPGVYDWLLARGNRDQLADLVDDIDDATWLLPFRGPPAVHVTDTSTYAVTEQAAPPQPQPERWQHLAEWLYDWERTFGGDVWIDAGTGQPPAAFAEAIDQRWLITRACYLSLHRASTSPVRPTGVVLIDEPGRSLTRRDVERSNAAPIVAAVAYDPQVARSVDAGLLTCRPPTALRRSLRRAAA